jgi:hypothetical protein
MQERPWVGGGAHAAQRLKPATPRVTPLPSSPWAPTTTSSSTPSPTSSTQTNPTVKREVLRDLLPIDGGTEVEEAVMNWFDQEVDRGRRDGEHRGERKGRRALLLKQLRLRFGELPVAVVGRIEAAEVQELDVCAERFVTAWRIEDVLGPG